MKDRLSHHSFTSAPEIQAPDFSLLSIADAEVSVIIWATPQKLSVTCEHFWTLNYLSGRLIEKTLLENSDKDIHEWVFFHPQFKHSLCLIYFNPQAEPSEFFFKQIPKLLKNDPSQKALVLGSKHMSTQQLNLIDKLFKFIEKL
jgi:hypothetical protein